jgi:aminoglycoside phosphotransferase (APT) family kinase protein
MSTPPRKYLGDVVDVKTQHRFDEARLNAFLSDTVDGYEGPVAVRQFEGGQSNPTYFLETRGAKYVLRRKPPGVLLKSAHAVDREFRVMSALYEAGFVVPEPLILCEDAEVLGTAFYVMRHVPGRIFLDNTLPDLDRDQRGAVFDSVNATLARLHSFDLGALGLEDYGRPGNFFERQISRWSKQYDSSRTQDIPAMDKLIAWLPTAVPKGGETRISHGDYSFHNVMIHPTETHVVAVLDWELSTTGDPLGDLMYHAMEWYRPPVADQRGSLDDRDLGALGIPTLDDYVARYCERVGRPPVENLAFHKAYNLFRVAAIIQGIAWRAVTGAAVSADADAQAARVPPIAEAAWRFAQEGGAL